MALDKATLQTELETGFKEIFNRPNVDNNIQSIAQEMAQLIADKVDVYVKTGKVTGTISNGGTIVTSQII